MLKTFSLYRKLLTLCRAGHDQGKAWGMNRKDMGYSGVDRRQ